MNAEFKVIEYKTASGATPQELDVAVMELLGSGYEPFGSPYLSDRQAESLGGNLTFYQAMVLSNKPRVNLREYAAHERPPSEVNVSVVTDESARLISPAEPKLKCPVGAGLEKRIANCAPAGRALKVFRRGKNKFTFLKIFLACRTVLLSSVFDE